LLLAQNPQPGADWTHAEHVAPAHPPGGGGLVVVVVPPVVFVVPPVVVLVVPLGGGLGAGDCWVAWMQLPDEQIRPSGQSASFVHTQEFAGWTPTALVEHERPSGH
jgi:hypothetical protein